MPFSLDPSIILGYKQYTGPDPDQTMRTLSQLALQGVQQRHAEATLADLVNQQQRQRTLQSIYASGGDPQALLRGGFGSEAYAAQDQQAQMAEKQNKLLQDQIEFHVRPLRGLSDQAGLDAAFAAWKAAGVPDEHLKDHPRVYNDQSKAFYDRMLAMSMSGKDAAEVDAKKEYYGALANRPRTTNTGTGQRMQYNPETGLYDIAIGDPKPSAAGAKADADGGLEDAAIDEAAQVYKRTGQMVPLGMGKAAAAARAKILNRAAGLEGDVAGNKADYHATTASLSKLQTQSDFIESFEKTALKNLDTFIGAAGDVGDAGSPYLNKSLRSMQNRFDGDPKMSRFIAAGQTARQEIAKILSGSTGNGALSDSARHEVEELIPADATLAQILAAADILKKDMANRKVAVSGQLEEMRGRTRGNAKKKADTSGKPPPNGHQTVVQNGHTFTWNPQTGEYE